MPKNVPAVFDKQTMSESMAEQKLLANEPQLPIHCLPQLHCSFLLSLKVGLIRKTAAAAADDAAVYYLLHTSSVYWHNDCNVDLTEWTADPKAVCLRIPYLLYMLKYTAIM